MTETAARPQEHNGHTASLPEGRPGRSFSYVTGECSIELGYAALTALMDEVFAVWDHMESGGVMDDRAGDMFQALAGRIEGLRRWTGWDGVPGKFLQ